MALDPFVAVFQGSVSFSRGLTKLTNAIVTAENGNGKLIRDPVFTTNCRVWCFILNKTSQINYTARGTSLQAFCSSLNVTVILIPLILNS